jgi:hypothetical protein
MLAAHAEFDRTAIDTLVGPMAVDMLSGGGLQAAVAVGRFSAVNTTPLRLTMLVKPVDAL